MSLSQFLELAINKLQKLKKDTPLTKNPQNYEIKSIYVDLFSSMFIMDLDQKIKMTPEMNQDMSNFCQVNNSCFRDSVFSNTLNYNEISDNNRFGLKYVDSMNECTKTYIKKICEVILNDNYDINSESDVNIISYYWVLKFMPVYYEIATGAYKILDTGKRYELANKINQYITLINITGFNKNALQINIDSF